MTKKEFKSEIDKFNVLLMGEHKFNSVELYNLYYSKVSEFTKEDLETAVSNIMTSQDIRTRPSIFTLIKYLKEASGKNAMSGILKSLKRDITLFGPKMPNYKEEIVIAIESVGGWDILRDDESNETLILVGAALDKQIVENKTKRLEK